MKRIIALLMVAVIAISVCASCVTDAAEIKVKLKIVAGDDRIFDKEVGVSDPDGDGATVIEVVKEAIAQYELNITFDDAENSIKSVKNYKDCTIEEVPYFWDYKINDVTPETGRASTNYVHDGDQIVYTFCYTVVTDASNQKNIKTETRVYDSELGLFGEFDEEEPEEEADAEEAAE